MKIEEKKISIGQLTQGYKDDAENGVYAFGGLLSVRPPYQREFIYSDEQQKEVLKTVRQGFPLNVMYWGVNNNADDTYELIDGQQRTLSICKYVNGAYSIDNQYFNNLTLDERTAIMDYKLSIFICTGTEREKLEWFKRINIAGEKLTTQELRNSVYTGEWLYDAKRYFSRTTCPAYDMFKDYMTGKPIRQEYLETVLEWIGARDELTIEEYMAKHQNDQNANDIWQYFSAVVTWVKSVFPKYRKEMKHVPWGILYNKFGSGQYNTQDLETKITELMRDDDVTKKSGIYPFVLGGEEKELSIRSFTENQKREAYERQNGICPICGGTFDISGMEADHITPWHEGGRTVADNCQMLCKPCNRKKSGK